MWKLVKAEMAYNKFTFVMLVFTLSMAFMMVASLQADDIHVDSSLPHFIAVAILYLLFTTRYVEKRTRMIQVLPLSVTKIGIARLLNQGLYYVCLVLLYLVFFKVSYSESTSPFVVWQLCSLSALIILANAGYCLSLDIWADTMDMDNSRKVIVILVLWFVIFGLALFYTETFMFKFGQYRDSGYLHFLYFTPSGVIVQHVVAILVSVYSYHVYIKRRSYLA